MIAITHFALGLTTGLFILTPLTDRYDNSTLAIASGLWAMVPDIGHFVPAVNPALTGWWANIFWMHPTLDAIETSHQYIEAAMAVAFLALITLLLERKSYYNS